MVFIVESNFNSTRIVKKGAGKSNSPDDRSDKPIYKNAKRKSMKTAEIPPSNINIIAHNIHFTLMYAHILCI